MTNSRTYVKEWRTFRSLFQLRFPIRSMKPESVAKCGNGIVTILRDVTFYASLFTEVEIVRCLKAAERAL